MFAAALIGGLCVLPQIAAVGDVTVAVSPCIAGPRVSEEAAKATGQCVIAAMSEIDGVKVVDRSLTGVVVQEQDLWLASQATDALRARLEPSGANRLLVVSLSNTSSGFIFSLRLVEVATEDVLGCILRTAPSEKQVVRQCKEWTTAFWASVSKPDAKEKADLQPSEELASLWRILDETSSRQLLGPEIERAESVYRQYTKAAQAGKANEADRLGQMASIYLTDCLLLLQRVQNPPEGMVYVPSGWVSMSLPGGKTRRFRVQAFFIDRTEMTRGRYAEFLDVSHRRAPLEWETPKAESVGLPVTGVDWYDAEAAAAWRGLRLPTHLEYMRAVKGDRESKYPWGDTWRAERCVFAQDPRHMAMEPAGSRPEGASPWGVLDGVGSACEWLDTWQGADYWLHAPEKAPPGPPSGSAKLAAGGGYRTGPAGCTCDSVEAITPETRRDDLGFRCVLRVKESTGGSH